MATSLEDSFYLLESICSLLANGKCSFLITILLLKNGLLLRLILSFTMPTSMRMHALRGAVKLYLSSLHCK